MERHLDLLAAMLEDLEQADAAYRPTHYWRICSRRLLDDLERHGIEGFRSWPAALTHFVPTYHLDGLAQDPRRHAEAAAALEAALGRDPKTRLAIEAFLGGRTQALADYRVFVAADRDRPPYLRHARESSVGRPAGQFQFEGRNYSRSMLNYLLGLCFLKRELEEVPVRTVLEIGGGFGTLGEILLGDARNGTFYVDVDIPPTACFSTYYLQEVLGRERVLDYLQTRERESLDLEELRRDGGAAVLCPWQLPRLQGSVDLFVNFISFQEMEPDVVQGYLAHVARLGARHVLLRNLREGKQLARGDGDLGVRVALRGEDYDRFLPGYELVATNVHPFGFLTVDGFHSELRLYRRR